MSAKGDRTRDARMPSSLRPTVSAVDMDAFLRELGTVKLRRVSHEGLDNSFSSSAGSVSLHGSQSSANSSSSLIPTGLDRSRLRKVAPNGGNDSFGCVTMPVEGLTKLPAIEQSNSFSSSWRSRFFEKLRAAQNEENHRDIALADDVAKKRKRSVDLNRERLRGPRDAQASEQPSKKLKPNVAALSQGWFWFAMGQVHAHESSFSDIADPMPNNDASNSVMSLISVPSPTYRDHHSLRERLPHPKRGHSTPKDVSLPNANASPQIRTLSFLKNDGAKVKKPPKKAAGNISIPMVSSSTNAIGVTTVLPEHQHLGHGLASRRKPTNDPITKSVRVNGRLMEKGKRTEPPLPTPPSAVSTPGGDGSVKREDDNENNIPRFGMYITIPTKPARDGVPSPLDSAARIAASPMPATPRRIRAVRPRRRPLNSSPPSSRHWDRNGPGQRDVSDIAITSDTSVIRVKEEDDISDSQAVGELSRNCHLPGFQLTLADEISIAQDPREPDDILDAAEYTGVGTKRPHERGG